ncbi:MAG TPA: DNA mismatch repair endonuclease MutL [Candidatus Synoicihabitans sp.]|nr:DNA mismatch repair endonuclease MutL [Candidatus Synoicihabitans sp.]
MPDIRILPDRVANQIAAGEVIERPAAVVKELVENALDAGATRIEVEFRQGGRALMRVEDNGHGMTRDNALLALERHATSKIAEAADLDRLASFGFRGEALPSIASVSRFTLQTRALGADVGTEVLVSGGRMLHVRDCGRAVGTRIEVAHLFNSVPARRKFLKRDETEAAHIIAGVRLYALAFPHVAFVLIEDGRVIFRSPECPALGDRIGEIFGRQIAGELVPLQATEHDMKLSGLIGRPGAGRSTRHEMVVYVNRRPVDSRTLNYALIESYHESLPKGRYPLAFVFFEIDPAAVDVNVHPAKREVRFRSEPSVRGFVIRSILGRLRELTDAGIRPLTTTNAALGLVPAPLNASVPSNPMSSLPPVPVEPAPAPVLRVPAVVPPARAETGMATTLPLRSTTAAAVAPAAQPRPEAVVNPSWRFLGVAHGVFGLFETPSGLVLLDRRAAHERIWFERLQDEFRAEAVASQRLLLPVPVELDPIGSALLLDRQKFLRRYGWEVDEFGRNFFRIEAVPAWLEPGDAEPFLRDLLGAMRDGRLPESNLDLAREELARLAASKAVRLPEAGGAAEWHGLVAQLFACRAPHTSPGGRATHFELSHGELARRFQR